MDKFFIGCLGVAMILGFIYFGVLIYGFIGIYSLLPTAIFIGLSIMGLNAHTKEIKTQIEKELASAWRNNQ